MAIHTPESVYRLYETMGVPESGKHEPKKSEIIQLLNQLFGTSRGGWVVARTLAELNGVTPESETDGGVVLTGAGAGYYDRGAGVWVFGRGFPDTFASLSIAGGTANAVQAIAELGVSPSIVEVFVIQPVETNTGPVTLSIAGEPPKPVHDVNGNPLTPGAWTAGRKIMLTEEEEHYRLLSDPDADGAAASAAASAESADEDADRAEVAADLAEGYAAGLNLPTVGDGDAGKVLFVNSESSGYELKDIEGEFDGALVHFSSDASVSVPNSYSSPIYVALPYVQTKYDIGDYWDPSTNEFVVPADIPPNTYAIFRAHVRWEQTDGYRVQVLVSKYDASAGTQLESAYPECMPSNMLFTGGTTADHFSQTHPILLEPGDRYGVKVWQQGATGGAGPLIVLQSAFSMNLVKDRRGQPGEGLNLPENIVETVAERDSIYGEDDAGTKVLVLNSTGAVSEADWMPAIYVLNTPDETAPLWDGPVNIGTVAQRKGTITNDDAAPGDIGEYRAAELAYASRVTLVSGSPQNVISSPIILSPGDWDVWGLVHFEGTGSPVSAYVIMSLAAASAALNPNAQAYGGAINGTVPQTTASHPGRRVSVAVNTNYYLTAAASWSGGSSVKAWGGVYARRVR